jgi:gamma-glutamyl hydrolase
MSALLGAVLVLVAISVAAYPTQPADPVIGILSSPLDECPPIPARLANESYNACVFSYAMRLLEAQGVRTVVFPWNMSLPQQRKLASQVNGVWLPGGGLWFGRTYNEYLGAITRLYNIAVEMNAKGDPFLLWGTCWGWEMLAIAAAGGDRSVITSGLSGMEPLMMAVNFTQYQPNSSMLGGSTTPSRILEYMSTRNTTLNWHRQAVLTTTLLQNAKLGDAFVPIATTLAPSGNVSFVAAAESRHGYNIFGIQFHPERPPFEFANDAIGHTPEDIEVSHYFGRLIATRLRLNNHSFASALDVEARRIAQWPMDDIGWGIETYFVRDPVA